MGHLNSLRLMLMLGLTSCATEEMTRLETQQRSLEREVNALRGRISGLRASLERSGAVKAGPVRKAGSMLPKQQVTLELEIKRKGSPPPLALPRPQKRSSPCGYRLPVTSLEMISDGALGQAGFGAASPLVMAVEGKVLRPHSITKSFEKACVGKFRHQGRYLFFSPPENTTVQVENIALALDPQVPTTAGDGRRLYWVYPGTSLTVTITEPWDSSWGDANLTVRALAVEIADQVGGKAARGEGSITLSDGKETHKGSGPMELLDTISSPEKPFTITLSSPPNGPFILLDELIIGNESTGFVVATSTMKPRRSP